jgi:ketosteroid isomerase-like protein
LVALYEPNAVLIAEDGSQAVGLDAIRAAYEATVSFGGTLTLQTRYAVECGELALLSNEYTFSMPGYEATWITAELARRQPDGGWKYLIDNPYAAPAAKP